MLLAVLLAASIGPACVGSREAPPTPRTPRAGSPASRAPAEATRAWTLQTVDDGVARGAVCNDGQPATYLTRPGAGPDASRWVIFLEGGGLCSSVPECRARAPHRRRPAGRGAAPAGQGIFDVDAEENPDFHGWSAAFLPYCSSDFWLGDRGADDETGGLAFRGARIVDAVIADLRAGIAGMEALSEADVLLLLGGSAGSQGARHHADALAATLEGTRVLLVLDSALEPWREAELPHPGAVREADQLALWRPRLDASCVEAVGARRCLDGVEALRHVEVATFGFMDQLDNNALTRAGFERGDPRTRRFGSAVLEHLGQLEGSFSTHAGIHVLAIRENFHALRVRDPDTGRRHSYAEVLGAWASGRPGPRHVHAAAR